MSYHCSTQTVTLIHGKVVTPAAILTNGWVMVQGDIITQVGEGDTPPIDAEVRHVKHSAYIIPGFVDIHNHGVGGCEEVCDHWSVPEYSLQHLIKSGTTSVLASLIFSTKRPDAVLGCIRAIEERVGKATAGCAVIEGIHAEGPLVADSGGLPPCETNMSLDSFKALCAAMPSLKVMTIAPSLEAPRGYDRLQHLLTLGVRPSLGHDKRCDEKAILGALALGSSNPHHKSTARHSAMHITHCFNVMAPLHHRQVGLTNFAFCRSFPLHTKYAQCQPPTVEVIGDLIHVHPLAMLALFSARNLNEDVAVISDCIAHNDNDNGSIKYNGRRIITRAEGGCFLTDSHGRPTPTLAGSTSTLADQLYILIKHFGINIVTACRMLSTTPSRIARIDDRVGSIAVGKKANLLLLNQDLNVVEQTMVYGVFTGEVPYLIKTPTPTHLSGEPAKQYLTSRM